MISSPRLRATIRTFIASVLILGAVATVAWPSAVIRYIGGDRYEKRQDQWSFIDEQGETWEVSPGRIAVRFGSQVESIPTRLVLGADTLGIVHSKPGVKGYYRYLFHRSLDAVDVLDLAVSDPRIDDAYLDTRVRFFGSPDPYLSNQWNITRMRVAKAWRITAGSSSLTIAVLDTGFEIAHEDFVGGVWTNEVEASGEPFEDDDLNGFVDDISGWDFVSNDNDPSPEAQGDEHGTAVAGITAASRDNGIGIAGVAGGDAAGRSKLVPIRVDTTMDVEDAVGYCWRQGFDILNMSFGTNDPGGNTAALLDSAAADGAILILRSPRGAARRLYSTTGTAPGIATARKDRLRPSALPLRQNRLGTRRAPWHIQS